MKSGVSHYKSKLALFSGTSGARPLSVAAVLALLLASVAGCSGSRGFITRPFPEAEQPPPSDVAFTVYLYGDGGEPLDSTYGIDPQLRLLGRMLAKEDSAAALVFLGDNLYPSGMPPENSPIRPIMEEKMLAQIAAAQKFEGPVFFIPGNHDWGGMGIGGEPETLRREELFVERVLDRGNSFLPDNGFPGPDVVELTPELVLVLVDTQWWLEPAKIYGDTGQYTLEVEGEFLVELDDILRRYQDRHVLVVGHHPTFSQGSHGGQFPLKKDLYVLPTLARRYLGTPQDLSNRKYRIMADGMLKVFKQHDHLVYAAGHEHTLQYFSLQDQRFIISGSGSKDSYVAKGGPAAFASSEFGFARNLYYRDGSAWVEFWVPIEDGATGRIAYRAQLFGPSAERAVKTPLADPSLAASGSDAVVKMPSGSTSTEEEKLGRFENAIDNPDAPLPFSTGTAASAATNHASGPDESAEDTVRHSASFAEPPGPTEEPGLIFPAGAGVDESMVFSGAPNKPYTLYADSVVTVSAGDRYRASAFRTALLGKGYRDFWTANLKVPVIDLERTAGGLTVLKKGGGLQTVSLRMEGADGRQYVLRSIDKDPSATVPSYLRKTVAAEVVQDLISSMNPYGAFIIPALASAAGVLHTHPSLVVVPHSDRLGIYKDDFGGMLALFEARPDEDWSDAERFGYSKNLVGTPKMFEEVQEDNDERIDVRNYARARLFDMFVGDWDRHKDQWRWAEFRGPEGKVYKPIPRDRDFAFFRFGGLPAKGVRFLGDPKMRRFTQFGPKYGDVLGLNYNGASLDRRITGPLTRMDWLEIADSLQASLTDSVLEAAVRAWPEPLYGMEGQRYVEALKGRRDRLPKVAGEYYDLLANIVDLFGTDKHERFEINRLKNDRTEVVVYKTKKEGDVVRELYRRTFLPGETKEIRIYGFGGNDTFHVTGEAEGSQVVRIIGGPEADRFYDDSDTEGRHHVVIYDNARDSDVEVGRDTKVNLSDDERINLYFPLRFEYPIFAPVALLGYNENDGLFLGGGIKKITPRFRKYPYGSSQVLGANVAVRTQAYNVIYRGHFVQPFDNHWDVKVNAEALAAEKYRSFYGLGNETQESFRDQYNAKLQLIRGLATFSKHVLPFTTASFGPKVEYANMEAPGGIDEKNPPADYGFSAANLRDKYYAGAYGSLLIDGRDTLDVTQSGLYWLNEAESEVGVRHTDDLFLRLSSEMAYFYTFDFQRQLTLAFRVGGAHTFGDFAFFQANTLGGESNLRGFRRTRFAGRTALFQNAEARLELFNLRTYLMRGSMGAIGFIDNGRVWADDSDELAVPEREGIFKGWHQGYGGGLWINPFYRIVITGTMGFSDDGRHMDVSLGFLF